MAERGWKQLLAGDAWRSGPGAYKIEAYSEFMPPPHLGQKAYGDIDSLLFADDDPWGWRVSEHEEQFELRPGLAQVGKQILRSLWHLGRHEPAHGFARAKLAGNPYWPDELKNAVIPPHERYVTLLPLALSKTQDDKGRVRWTLCGSSEQGPSRGFWKSFFVAPRGEADAEHGLEFIRRLLETVYGEPAHGLGDLARAGFRILDDGGAAPGSHWNEPKLPAWTRDLLLASGRLPKGLKYLLTFRPFSRLPPAVRRAYLAGELHLLPFPGSLCFWGGGPYSKLEEKLPLASQIPLLHLIERHEAPSGLRVPQSGWLHEPTPEHPEFKTGHGPLRNTFRRTHRWAKVHRQDDELALTEHEDKMAHVLFSTAPDDLGLYGKPMARNAQIWGEDFRPLLDGPRAGRKQLIAAAAELAAGGAFGYRFVYPAMRVGPHEVYWHRPLVGHVSAEGEPRLLESDALGYMTAYDSRRPRANKPAIELWPRLMQRELDRQAVSLFRHEVQDEQHGGLYRRTANNVRRVLDAARLLEQPLEASFVRALVTIPRHESVADWLDSLPAAAADAAAAGQLADALRALIDCEHDGPAAGGGSTDKAKRPAKPPPAPDSITFRHTARRGFETKYWKTILSLAAGKYLNKDNADCALDPATLEQHPHSHRDLEALGDYLLAYYARLIAASDKTGKAWAGELPFQWRTDFDFNWQGGWLGNQRGQTYERNLIVMIPGRDRRRAVIFADHYDTAYMEDHYGYGKGGGGPRLAAAGADDNHSATATLMLAAPIFLELSAAGKLECDVWLVHLTGEEFPSDCMGARHVAQGVVEGALAARQPGKKRGKNIGGVRIDGLYVMDMIAHNNDRHPDIFQICPGQSRQSLWLALQAHLAARAWNQSAPAWNRRADRQGRGRGRRSADGVTTPAVALHPQLAGEVRVTYDPHSTLYNTDGQIFSDAGIPCVLFMENYDINRKGYHDSFDTMENIDLDYGSALAAIAIESVARAATLVPPWRAKRRKTWTSMRMRK